MAPNEKRFQSCLAGNYYTLLSNLRLAGLPGEMLLCWKTWKKLRSGGWLLLLFRAEESGVEPISPCPVGADVTVIESEKELSLGSSSSCGMEGRRRPGMRRVK